MEDRVPTSVKMHETRGPSPSAARRRDAWSDRRGGGRCAARPGLPGSVVGIGCVRRRRAGSCARRGEPGLAAAAGHDAERHGSRAERAQLRKGRPISLAVVSRPARQVVGRGVRRRIRLARRHAHRTLIPRHWVLIVDAAGHQWQCYEPSSGEVRPVDVDAIRRARFSGLGDSGPSRSCCRGGRCGRRQRDRPVRWILQAGDDAVRFRSGWFCDILAWPSTRTNHEFNADDRLQL